MWGGGGGEGGNDNLVAMEWWTLFAFMCCYVHNCVSVHLNHSCI